MFPISIHRPVDVAAVRNSPVTATTPLGAGDVRKCGERIDDVQEGAPPPP